VQIDSKIDLIGLDYIFVSRSDRRVTLPTDTWQLSLCAASSRPS